MSNRKMYQQRVINALENTSDYLHHTINILIHHRYDLEGIDDKVDTLEQYIETLNSWVDEVREEQEAE